MKNRETHGDSPFPGPDGVTDPPDEPEPPMDPGIGRTDRRVLEPGCPEPLSHPRRARGVVGGNRRTTWVEWREE